MAHKLSECDCGCGQLGLRSRMKVVRQTERKVVKEGSVFEHGRSYLVLPSCAEPWVKEMQSSTEMRTWLVTVLRRNWFYRLWVCPAIFKWQRQILARRFEVEYCRQHAWSTVAMVLRLEWLIGPLWRAWRRGYRTGERFRSQVSGWRNGSR